MPEDFTPPEIAQAVRAVPDPCTGVCRDTGTAATIIGCDDRERGPWNDRAAALSAPYRSIGSISTGGTGFLIGDRWVLTSAHNFNNRSQASWFHLAQYECANPLAMCHPYGKVPIKRIHIPAAYSTSDSTPLNKALDIALLELERPIQGATPLRYGHIKWSILQNKTARTIGYPADKGNGRTPYKHTTGSFIHSYFAWIFNGDRGVLNTDLDAFAGQSGGPIYTFHNGRRRVVGVINGSPVQECQAGRNWGARITPAIKAHIQTEMAGIDLWWARFTPSMGAYEPPDDV